MLKTRLKEGLASHVLYVKTILFARQFMLFTLNIIQNQVLANHAANAYL